jgi:hypothetical protein
MPYYYLFRPSPYAKYLSGDNLVVYETIRDNPGLNFKEIRRITGFVPKHLTYIINYLTTNRHIATSEAKQLFFESYGVASEYDEEFPDSTEMRGVVEVEHPWIPPRRKLPREGKK